MYNCTNCACFRAFRLLNLCRPESKHTLDLQWRSVAVGARSPQWSPVQRTSMFAPHKAPWGSLSLNTVCVIKQHRFNKVRELQGHATVCHGHSMSPQPLNSEDVFEEKEEVEINHMVHHGAAQHADIYPLILENSPVTHPNIISRCRRRRSSSRRPFNP